MKIAISSTNIIDKKSPYGMCKRLGTLADALVDLGHQVDIYAQFDSKTKAKVYKTNKYQIDISEQNKIASYYLITHSQNYDIINATNRLMVYLSDVSKCPMVLTIAYAEYARKQLTLLEEHSNIGYIAQSNFVKKLYPKLNWIAVIYNGVDTNYFKPCKNPTKDYLLFLGRIVENKGSHLAVQIAKKLNQRLIIAGQIEDQKYFDTKIKPFLSIKIKYIGALDYKNKIKYLQNALALIAPGKYKESCSNVIIESLACCTPVIAQNAGSNSELVDNGVTGFVGNTPIQLQNAIKQIHNIDRNKCRKETEKRFSAQVNVKQYVEAYKKMIKLWQNQKSS